MSEPAELAGARSNQDPSLSPADLWGALCALAALFSGVALVVHILTGLPLLRGLAFGAAELVVVAVLVWRRASAEVRRRLLRTLRDGILAGAVATVAYDAARIGLSRLDPSPYNPFEAIRMFGTLVLGEAAAPVGLYAVGAAFHFVNGITFAVAYYLIAARPRPLTGIAWALGLETMQLLLYPGWLGIVFMREFAQISAASHVIYGTVLGAWPRSKAHRGQSGGGILWPRNR